MSKQVIYLRSTSIINDSRASKEINSLINNGYNVFVLGWDRDKTIKDYKKININNNSIKGCFFKFNANYGESIKNILGLILFQIWLFIKLLKNNKRYEIIHACDLDCGFIAFLISRILNKKLVYDMYDYYSDSRPMPKPLEKIINKFENVVINNANVAIICGEWRFEQIKGAKPKKVSVIHNTPDIRNIQNKNIIKSNSSKIKIGYVGILQDHRLLKEIINEIKGKEKYELHIGGFGKHKEFIEHIENKYENIFYYGSLPYNDVLCLEKDCDILFATYDPEIKNHKYSAPNKIYEAMALGKPIIVCKNTGIDKMVSYNEIGLVIKYNAKDFINKLDLLIKNKNDIKIMGNKAKKLYETKYNWISMEKELLNIYNNLGGKK